MTTKRKTVIVIFMFFILVLFVTTLIVLPKVGRKIYKKPYAEIVQQNSEMTGLDEHIIYAVIYTESKFDEKAVSKDHARGLMQIIEDAFDWLKWRMDDDDEVTFDDMFIPEYNIRYGCYYLEYLYEKYGDYRLAFAAYHQGMTAVDEWLSDENISSDGKSIDEFPSSVTNHYVNKVMNAWEQYNALYKD